MPASPPRYPVPLEALRAHRSWLVRVAGRAYMRLFGWRFVGDFPTELKFVCVVAPHTSNWDFFLGLAVLFSTDLKVAFLGKHSIFRWPVEGLLKKLGGIPVDRSAASGVVGQTVAAFEAAPALMLALAPEGTRKGESRWKSGFHAIAMGAGVPIFPVAFDFGTRRIRFMPVYHPSGTYETDLAALQAMYAGVKGQRERIRL
jgi:1-acyl-sn-glycerol-3-phosphate acyltransferase